MAAKATRLSFIKTHDQGVLGHTSKVLFLAVLMVFQTAITPMVVQPGWTLSNVNVAKGAIADGSDDSSAVGSTDSYQFTPVDITANITDFDDDGIPDFMEDINGDGNLENDDTDGDGLPNYNDTDDDNDGWLTSFECPDAANGSCPTTMGRPDYLDANLFNCDVPFLARSNGSHLQISALDWTDYTLDNLTTVRYNDTSTLARSFTDGRVYWLSQGTLYAWNQTGGVDAVVSTDLEGDVERLGFNATGVLLATNNGTLRSVNTTSGASAALTTLPSGLGELGDLYGEANGSVILTGVGGTWYRISNDYATTWVVNTNAQKADGALELANGTVLASNGARIIRMGSPAASLSAAVIAGTPSDDGKGQDMAACPRITADSDGDGVPDMYELNVFGTDPNDTDSDNDGMSDGREVQTTKTDPATADDSDNDGVYDWFDDDDNGDGMPDWMACGVATDLPISNLGFEQPSLFINVTTSSSTVNSTTMVGWQTDASSGFTVVSGNNSGAASAEGDQHLLLNINGGNQVIWQNRTLWAGDYISYNVSHRATGTQQAAEQIGMVVGNSSSSMYVLDTHLGSTSAWSVMRGDGFVEQATSRIGIRSNAPNGVTGVNYVDGVELVLQCFRDFDGDGIRDTLDDDIDGDGLNNSVEFGSGTFPRDSDGDGMPDLWDLDSDNDLANDSAERIAGSDTTAADTDGDGLEDWLEILVYSDLADVNVFEDYDNDNVSDWLDDDDDNDGVPDDDVCYGPGSRNEVYDPSFEYPYEDVYVTEGEALWESNYETGGHYRVEIMHANSPPHGDQHLEVELTGSTVVWQDMPFWKNDLIRWSMYHRARVTSEYTELSLMLDNASGKISVSGGVPTNAVEIANLKTTSPTWGLQSGIVVAPIDAKQFVLDPVEPATGAGNWVDLVQMNRTCMRDLDGDGIRDTIDQDIDGDGYNNSVEIAPVVLPSLISNLSSTFSYDFVNDAGNGASYDGFIRSSSGGDSWWGNQDHCDNSTSGNDGHLYWAHSAGHFASPILNLTGLGAATLNFWVSLDGSCRDPADEHEYMEVRYRLPDNSVTYGAHAPSMPVQWMRSSASTAAYASDYMLPGYLLRNDGSTNDLNIYNHGYTMTIELPPEAIHDRTQIIFDFPTSRDNSWSYIQIDDVLIHSLRYADTDDDGILDIVDLDSDNDLLTDAQEFEEGTNRTNVDSDGDQAWDGHEVLYFDTDPLGPDDTDGDLIPDWYDLDRNGDGVPDPYQCYGNSADWVQNGGFEYPGIYGGTSSNSFQQHNHQFVHDWALTTGWQIEIFNTSNAVLQNNARWPDNASEGDHVASLSSPSNPELWTEVTTNPGDLVTWSADFLGSHPTTADKTQVRWGSSTTDSSYYNVIGTLINTDVDWITTRGSFLVEGESDDILTFDYLSAFSSSEGNYLDNVIAIASCISDLDGDGITDAYDDDVDGDGILNSDEYGWDLDFDSTPETLMRDEYNWPRPNGEWMYFGNSYHDFRTDAWHAIYEEDDDYQHSLSFRGLGHSDYNSVTMQVEFDQSTNVSFDYYVNSENNYDWLVFCVDFHQCAWQNSGYTARWSGSADGRHTETIASGSHTLTWGAYTNGGTTHTNGNHFWIDNISIGDGLYDGDFDSDHDGVPDLRDLDSDGDTLLDEDEDALGTDPTRRDSDGDGMPDGYEIHWFDTNPLNANDDYDNDGITDWKDIDIDGDGVYNARECYNDQGTGSPSEDKQYAGSGLTELYWVDEGTFEDAAQYIGTSSRLASTSYSYPVSGAHWMQQHVEFHNGSQSSTDGYPPAFDGDQYMSLQWDGWDGANDISYLVTTSPGDLLVWGFAHLGHYNGHSTAWDELRVRLHTNYGEQQGQQIGYSYGNSEGWRYSGGALEVPSTYGQYAYLNIGDTSRRDWNVGQYIDGLTFTSYCRVDSDGDGVLNYYDDDSDDDGYLDSEETWDTDGDGWLDLFELDSDGDGINDDVDDDPRSAGKADWQGYALEFTGNGVVQLPDSASMDHADHTVQMWVLPNATIGQTSGQYSTVYSDLDGEFCDTASEGYAIVFDASNNRFGVELQNGFGTSSTECKSYWMSPNTAYEGTWTHLSVVFDDGTLMMLTDGGTFTSSWSSVPLSINDRQRPILGGEDKSSNPQHDEPFHGWLDEFRWWNRSLGHHEMHRGYNRLVTAGNDLVAVYGFETFSNGYVPDEMSTLSPAFVRNGHQHVTSAPLRDSTGAGHYYSFNGKSDEIQTIYRVTQGVNYAAEAWIRTTDTDSLTFIASEDINAGNKWELKMSYGYVGAYETNIGTVGSSSSNPDLFVADGLWHHVAFTKNRNCLYVFVDGSLEASRCSGGVGSTHSSARVTVGGSYAAYGTEVNFAGDMDEFRVWDHAISAEDVARRMTTTLKGEESGLLLYYTFDGGAGKEVKDDSFQTRWQTMVYGETTWSRLGRGYADGAPVYAFEAPSQAAVINGTGFISDPILDVRLMGEFTLEASVLPFSNQTSSEPTVFSTVDATEGGFALGVSLDANGNGGVDLAWGDVTHRMNDSKVQTNAWVHVAIVYDETSLHVYTNGTYVGSWAPANRNDPGGLGVIRVGTHLESGNASRTFSGAIDALHLWSVPLSAQAISDTWDVTPISSHPDLMASWTFDATTMRANPFEGTSHFYDFESGLENWTLVYRWGTARSRDWCNAYYRHGYSIRLASGNGTSNAGPSLTSEEYDMADAEFAQIRFKYNSWTRCWDAQDSNDVLYLEYLDSQGSWQEISDYPRQRTWYNTMVPNTVLVPSDALYDGVKFRFRYYANYYDYIFIDDISVEYGIAPSSARILDVTPTYALSGATVSDVDTFHLALDTESGSVSFIEGAPQSDHQTNWGVIDLESSWGSELNSDSASKYVQEVSQDHPKTLTLEGWFRPETLRGNDWNQILTMKSCRNFDTADGYGNWAEGWRSLAFGFYDSSPSLIKGHRNSNTYHYHSSYYTSNNEVIQNGEWNHVAWVIDVTSSNQNSRWMKGYVNGVHVTTNNLNDGYTWTGAMDAVSLGENNYRCDTASEDRYDGQIGALRLHPHAFTADEIVDRMHTMPVDDDAIFAYDFTDGNEYATDLTGNYHLSMTEDESANVYNQPGASTYAPFASGNLRDADDVALTWRTVGTDFGPSTNNVELATPIPVSESTYAAMTSDDDTGMWLDYPSGDTVIDVNSATHRFSTGGIAFDDLLEEEFTAAGTTNATVRLRFDLEAMGVNQTVQNELRLLIDNGTGYSLHALAGSRSGDMLTFASVPFVLGSDYRLGYVEAPGNFTYQNVTIGFENDTFNVVKPIFMSGDVQACTASSNLPAGLSVAANCTVSGTPTTQFWPPINVTFTATGPAGTVSTVMNMAVLDDPTVISYNPTSKVLTRGVNGGCWRADEAAGAANLTWSIDNTLPNGMTFDTSTGDFCGTPTTNMTTTQFTVKAENIVGSNTSIVFLTVNEPTPVITFSSNSLVLIKNELVSITTTSSGGHIASAAISPGLPAGLSLTSNGSIIGRPLGVFGSTQYTVYANNSGGTDTTTITLSSRSAYYYSQTNVTLFNEVSLINYVPTVNYSGTLNWSVNPTLPAGLSIGSSNGTIYGTPSEQLPTRTTFTVRATSSTYTHTFPIKMQIIAVAPSLEFELGSSTVDVIRYEPVVLKLLNDGDALASVSVSPSLPQGWQLLDNGSLYVLPQTLFNATTYTVYGENTGGNDTASITLRSVTAFSYTTTNWSFTRGVSNVQIQPTVNFSGSLSWTTYPSLPSGLSIGSANGSIYGVPTQNITQTTYIIRAASSNYTHTSSLSISIAETAPIVRFNVSGTVTFIVNEVERLDIENVGGTIANASVSPALPSGLSLNNDGSISGVPTNHSATTTYTVTVYNSGGTSSATVNLRVVGAFWYSQTTFTLREETNSIFAVPTVNYTGNLSWSTYPTLPAGMAIGSSNGTVYGLPTESISQTNFTIRAWSDTTMHSAVMTITVLPVAPQGTYNTTGTVVLSVGQAVWLVYESGGGAPTNITVSPGLPSGLSMLTNGTIYGTPSAVQAATTYTLNMSNPGGSDSITVTFEVRTPFHYSNLNHVLTRNQSLIWLSPTVNLTESVTWSVFPSLPSGISIGSSNGTIYGTPTQNLTQTNFTIRAQTWSTIHTATMSLEVLEITPSFSFAGAPSRSFILNEPVVLSPTSIGGPVASATVSPSLPSGLYIDSGGSIRGTPTSLSSSTTYTITGFNSGGNDTATITIEVVTAFTYSTTQHELRKNTSVMYLQPTVNLTQNASWSTFPTLPAGLTIGSANGTIYGTPTVNLSTTTFTVRAQTNATVHQTTLSITVLEQAPNVAWNVTVSSIKHVVGEDFALSLVNTGGPISVRSISPSLPSGLTLQNDGSISGSVSTTAVATSYTVTVGNSGGNDTATITIEFVDAFYYGDTSHILRRDTTALYLLPSTNLTGNVSWSVFPSLPSGLSIGSANGTLFGIPTVNSTLTNYTVSATTNSTTHTFAVALEVIEIAPSLSLFSTSTTITMVKNEGHEVVVLNAGGPISSVSVSPSLPNGLSLTSNGSIVGTPRVFLTSTNYTITTSNSGGTDSIVVNLEIVGPFYYEVTSLVMERSVTSVFQVPVVNFSSAASWSITPSLPTGLSLSSTNGTLSGVPSQNQTATNFTIQASTADHTHTFVMNLRVIEAAPVLTLSASQSTYNLPRGESVTILVNNAGGPIASISVSPSLPNGMTLTANGSLSGTPTSLSTATTYTITASNEGGSDNITVNFAVVTAFNYATTSYSLQRNASYLFAAPVNNLTASTFWSVMPSLPAGLTIGSSNGTLYGVPAASASMRNYTVLATTASTTHTFTVQLAVTEAAPDISWNMSGSSVQAVVSEPVFYELVNDGGAFTSISIWPALPQGLSLASNGSIVGTPASVQQPTTYMVNVSNDGGSDSITLSLSIVTAFTYGVTDSTMRRNITSVYLPPTVNVSGNVSWSVVPSLPSGLSIGASNGTIYGTPTQNLSQTTYTVRLTTANAVHTTTLTLTVLEQAPDISGFNSVTLITKEQADLTVTSSGGPVSSFSISPSLPAGLMLTSSGTITGTPTGFLDNTIYALNATNSGGTDTMYFTLRVVSAFDYSITTYTLQRGSTNMLVYPTVNTTANLSWTVTPSLPNGLSIGSTNGTIYGVATQTVSLTNYTVQAVSGNAVHSAVIRITVSEPAPDISFNTTSTTLGLVINEAVTIEMVNNGGAGSSVAVSPALPSGLTLTNNGSIVGTPNALGSFTTYTVWVNNSGGSDSVILILGVVSAYSYTITNLTLTRNISAVQLVPSSNLTASHTWSVFPSLPSGLSFGTANGTVYGMPTHNSTRTTYTITATTASALHTWSLSIEVNEVAPDIDLNASTTTFTLVKRESFMLNIVNTGGPIATMTVSPALPAGLSLTANGRISGTPTAYSGLQSFTVWANNSGGSSSVTFSMEVVSPFEYSATSVTAQRGSSYVFLEANSNLSGTVSWSVLPSLPNGLSIGSANGTIYGTPSQNMTQTNFTIRAVTASATHLAQLTITVLEASPMVSYTTATLTVGEQVTHAPNTTGGPVASFSVSPALPTGLSLDQYGRLIGSPTANMTLTTYAVWANNSGGSSQAVLRIVVYENAPEVSLPMENITLTYNSAITPITPINMGGAVRNWSVSPSLPSGLSLNAYGQLTGTPVSLVTNATYTLWATNDGGVDRFIFNLSVQEMSPSIQFTQMQNNYTVDDSVSITLVNSGGNPSTYAISPSLPTGLVLSSTNGSIYGVAMAAQSVTQYTVWANNTQGSAQATVFIRINEGAPSISYPVTWLNLTRFTPMQPVMPQVSNANSITWLIQPSLPVGLSFNNTTGLISGTPTQVQSLTKYTITVMAGSKSSTADLWLSVAEARPSIAYDVSELELVNGTAMPTLFPTTGNASIDSWSITPALPTGLMFVNGVLYGTANVTSNTTLYTITASNSGGHHNVTMLITVLLDSDGDGQADRVDSDDDNDGVIDVLDPFPLDPSESIDTDYDGIGNNADLDDDNDGTNDTDDAFPLDPKEDTDLDNDGLGDNADTDDDGDGCEDLLEDYPRNGSMCFDFDLDGIGDAEDEDDDNDGYNDAVDAFPYNRSEWNDTDMDGIGDRFDDDDDGDNYTDVMDAFPYDPREWLDSDGDGFGDNADPDDDNDGVADLNDPWPLDPRFKYDANNNTIPDIFEASNLDDVDEDGWSNMLEYICDTNATNSTDVPADFDEDGTCDVVDMDDDGDGYADQDDDLPFNRSEWLDTDDDGIGNNADKDDDGDGYKDGADAFPLDSTEWEDLNGNGIGDNSERKDTQEPSSVSQGASALDQVPVWLLVLIVLTGTLLLTILFATGSATRSKAGSVVARKPVASSVEERFNNRSSRAAMPEVDEMPSEEGDDTEASGAVDESNDGDADEQPPSGADDSGEGKEDHDSGVSTKEETDASEEGKPDENEADDDPDFREGPLN